MSPRDAINFTTDWKFSVAFFKFSIKIYDAEHEIILATQPTTLWGEKKGSMSTWYKK